MEIKNNVLTFTLKVKEETFITEDNNVIKYLDCYIDVDGEKIRFKPVPYHKELFRHICKDMK